MGNDSNAALQNTCSALAKLEGVLYATGADSIDVLVPDIDSIYCAQAYLEQGAANETKRHMAVRDASDACCRLADAFERNTEVRADIGAYGIDVILTHLRQTTNALATCEQAGR